MSPKEEGANYLFDVALKRYQALNGILTDLQMLYGRKRHLERRNVILSLLDGLQKFAEGQFYFFYKGFGGTKTPEIVNEKLLQVEGKLPPSLLGSLKDPSRYPQEYVLKAIIEQVSYDLEVIQRTAHQRYPLSAATLANLKVNSLDTLELADRLAFHALKKAKEKKWVEVDKEPTVITYFQKSSEIRLIPYASVAVIGIPYTCVTNPVDLLAIPHEIGHYLYWYGSNGQKAFSQILKSELTDEKVKEWSEKAIAELTDEETEKWREKAKKWSEEVFADVFGCLIGGEMMALSIQDLQLASSEQEFITDDGKHPTPMVRPQVYHDTLSKMKRDPQALKTCWQEQRKARIKDPQDYQPKPDESLITHLTNFIYDKAFSNETFALWFPTSDTLANLQIKKESLQTKDFDDRVRDVEVPDVKVEGTDPWVKWMERFASDDGWESVFEAAGWTSGPVKTYWPPA